MPTKPHLPPPLPAKLESTAVPPLEADAKRLLHELQVHQVELEMQNAELLAARAESDALLAKYTDLYDFSPVCYFTFTTEGQISLANLTASALLGVERSRLLGRPFALLICEKQRAAFHDFLTAAFADKGNQEGDFELVLDDATRRSVKLRTQDAADGQCSVVMVDISERALVAEKMAISEMRYRRLFETAHDGVLLLDPATRKITDANPFMTQLLGYSREELVGKELFEIGLLKDEGASQRMFEQLKTDGQVRYENLPLESVECQMKEVEVVANRYLENEVSVIQCNIRDITARRLAEVLQRASEVRLELGAKVAGLALVEVDYQTDQKHLTAAAARIFGLGDAALTVPRKLVQCLLHPADLPVLKPLMAASLDPTGDGILSMDHRIVRPDGAVRWLRVREQILFSGPPEARKPSHGSMALIDITDEKIVTEALRHTEARMRLATEATGVGIWEWNVITNEIHWDAQMFLIYGVAPTPNGIVPYTAWSGAVLPEDLPEQEAVLQDTVRRAGQSSRHFRIFRADDHSCRHIQCFETVRADAGGQAEWVVGTNLDVTERTQVDDILRRNEALFSALIQQAPVGVYVLDAQFRLQQMNSTALADFANVVPLLGRDFEEIVHILWSAPIAASIVSSFRHTLATGEPYQAPDLAAKRKDTSQGKVYEWSLQRVMLPAGEYGVVCFYSDITERSKEEKVQRRLAVITATNKKLTREIARRQKTQDALTASQQTTMELLAQSQQLQEQQRHLARQILGAQEEERKRVSRELHDVIAQSLTSINYRLAALQNQATEDPAALHEKILQAQQSVAQSVDTVHRFARDLRPSMLDDLGLMPALRTYLKEFTERNNLPVELTADESAEQLVSNARTVFYRVTQEALTNIVRHARATLVEINIHQQNGTILLNITDNGVGFTPETTSKNRLGLLGMRERVEMIGGTFSTISQPGGPTTISVSIPA